MTNHTPLILERGDLPSIAWPAVHGPRLAPLAALIHQIEETQWLSGQAIAKGQRAQLAIVAAHFQAQSPWFRKRLAIAGVTPETLGQPGGHERLPILSRREAQAEFAREPALTLPEGHGPLAKFSTSGSTGEPVIVWKTALSRLDWLALTMRYYRWGCEDFTGRLASIRALKQSEGLHDNWGAPAALFARTGPMLGIEITTDVEVQIEKLRAFAPDCLMIYPSTLDAITTALETSGKTLPSIKRLWTMGETLHDAARERASHFWGINPYDAYSSEEAGYIAVQCPEGDGYHTMDEMLIVEVVDADDKAVPQGVEGRVLVTDLRNHATPLIRYEIGDYAIRGGPCACGRGLGSLSRILGRERNMILNPDGTRHWPRTGFARYRDIAPILQYQMIQTARDRIELNLVSERPLTDDEETRLRNHILGVLKHPFAIEMRYHQGNLPRGPNGKFEEFVSRIGE